MGEMRLVRRRKLVRWANAIFRVGVKVGKERGEGDDKFEERKEQDVWVGLTPRISEGC
jgi:hypothetical protein